MILSAMGTERKEISQARQSVRQKQECDLDLTFNGTLTRRADATTSSGRYPLDSFGEGR